MLDDPAFLTRIFVSRQHCFSLFSFSLYFSIVISTFNTLVISHDAIYCTSLHCSVTDRTRFLFAMTDNHRNIKRKAHLVGRSGTDAWNPFRHVSWKKDRATTWGPESGGDLERGDETSGSPLGHTVSVPNLPSNSSNAATMFTPSQPIDEERSTADDPVVEKSNSFPPTENQNGLRNRGREDSSKPQSPVEDDDDKSKKMKEKEHTGMFRNPQPKTPFTVANQLQRTFLNSWINVLLIAAPVGIALAYGTKVDKIAVFVINFMAIIPLAAMLSFATEEIALRTGEVLGGLLNATFGNAVELIIAIIALIQNQVAIVQTSLVGSILSNLLLVMGFCFFFGGLRRTEQHFNTTVAQTAASLLALAVASVIVPSVFDYAIPSNVEKADEKQRHVAYLSRGTAVILLVVYAAYLLFQLKTHHSVFTEESQKVAAKPWTHGPLANKEDAPSLKQGLSMMPGAMMSHGVQNQSDGRPLSKMLMNPHTQHEEDEDEEEEPQLNFIVAIATLAISTGIIAVCADAMVGSINDLAERGNISKEFIGLILLPIVGNAAEHATAVTVAMKDKMDLAIGVAVGSSMQVALFLIPFLVVVGWGMGNDNMDLSFDMFQVAVMFVAVLLVNYLIGDGKSHWLEGWLLICLYAIIAVCSYCKSFSRAIECTKCMLTCSRRVSRSRGGPHQLKCMTVRLSALFTLHFLSAPFQAVRYQSTLSLRLSF